MECPVVIIHKGSQDYLKWALLQAKAFENDVVILGDEHNRLADLPARHIHIDSLATPDVDELRRIYVHMSTNSPSFELFCFERWFLLLEYCNQHGIDRLFHLDSDVLLFMKVDDFISTVANNPIAAYHIPVQTEEQMRWIASGHCSYWTREGLKSFCSYILDVYRNQAHLLKKKWDWHNNRGTIGGICDMTLLYMFYNVNRDRIVNFAITQSDQCIDMNINTGDNYFAKEYSTRKTLLQTHMKIIEFKNNLPYCFNELQGKSVQFLCLHCQGRAKLYMFKLSNLRKKISDLLPHYLFTLSFLHKKSLLLIKKTVG